MKPIRGSRVDYYTRQLAQSREEYLSGKGEAPGRWAGAYAERFRLHGKVTVEQFERMYAWQDPATGAQLGRGLARNSNATLEVVFRPPKDIALLWAFGDQHVRNTVMAGLREANTAAMGLAERSAGTRVGKGGREHVAGSGLLWATFTHRVNRENEPLPHFHNVVMNRTQGPDSKWRTLDGRDLIDTDAQRALDAVFTSVLQHALSRDLGVEFTPADAHGFRQVVGISRESVETYSTRTQDITEAQAQALAEKIVKGGQPALSFKERDAEVQKTRKPKVYADMERLHDRWQRQDRERGLDTARQVAESLGRVRARDQLTPTEERALFDQLASPQGLTRQASTFTRHDVLKGIADQAGGLPLVELEQLADRFLADPARTLSVDVDERKPRWTTREARAVEERLLDLAAQDRPGMPVVDHEHLAEALTTYATLGEDQRQLVAHFTRNPGFVALSVGQAGTGKTFTVNACRHAWQRAGIDVVGAAHTGTAATQLRDGAGVEQSRTIDSWLLSIRNTPGGPSRVLPKGGVVVIDEAGQTDTRKLERFLQACSQAGCAVRMIGDVKQLQSIDMGGAFRALEARLGARELTVNRRQKDPLDREVLALLREGQAEEAMNRLVEAGRVTMAPDRVTKEQLILAGWWQDQLAGKEVDILSPVWEEVDRLNRRARQLRQVAGQLGPEMLVAGRRVAVGERVICRVNDIRRLGITNGSVGYVTAIDPKAGTLTLKTGGREVTLPRRYLQQRTGHGRREGAIDYAYARTRASVQGITNDRSHISALPGHGDLHDEYVAASRAREGFRIYGEYAPQPDEHGDRLQRAEALGLMTAAAGRERPQTASVDAIQGPGVHTMTLGDLRAERDQLAAQRAEVTERARGGRRLELRLSRAEAEQQQTRAQAQQYRQEAEALTRQAQALTGWWRRHERRDLEARARQVLGQAQQAEATAATGAGQVADLRGALDAYRAEQQRHTPSRERLRLVERELGDRTAGCRRALVLDTPAHLKQALGAYEPVAPAAERRQWETVAQRIQDYRQRHGITDPAQPLGPPPKDNLVQARERTRLARQVREVQQLTADRTRQRGLDWQQRHNRPADWRPGERTLAERIARQPQRPPTRQREQHGRDLAG